MTGFSSFGLIHSRLEANSLAMIPDLSRGPQRVGALLSRNGRTLFSYVPMDYGKGTALCPVGIALPESLVRDRVIF